MGKARDLFKKMRDTKGTYHSKIGTIKNRNGMDLSEAEDIKKRWQGYTEELCKKIFTTPWTAVYQAPPSIGFSRQEYWSGVPLPSPKDHGARYYSKYFKYINT